MIEFLEDDSVDLKRILDGVKSDDIPPDMKLLWDVQLKNKGEFRFGPIRAYVYLLAVSQSKCPDLLYFRLRYDFYTRIPLYK